MDSQKFMAALEHFRSLDAEIQAQGMLIFLTVAKNHPTPTPLSKLAESANIALSSASRNVYTWSKTKKADIAGHAMFELDTNPYNRRERIVSLSSKGERFYKTLLAL